MTERLRRASSLLAFAALCYLPLLATSPGKVVADTKSYLYIDPDRLLARAWSMWDPHVGMGTVTHQSIGFLWPMGPYYWLMEHLGLPDWVAQRLWLGSIMLAAGLGVRYLLRTFGWRGSHVAVAMCAYALTPYLLTIAVRISAILLPFAALPWLIALTARALRTGSWRHPAAFALVVTTVGTSNATSIVLVGVGPVLWVLWAAVLREHPMRRIGAALARIGVLTLATNAWWIIGLSVQAANGVEVLRYTESVEVTAAASAAQEVLRGLGYWFFYGDDAIGPWVGPSKPFQTSPLLLLVTFSIPVLAIAGGALARWRERSFAVLLALVGLALAVGVYPYRDPSPFGRALRSFLHSDVGMAMRSMPRAAPLVVLALSIMLGAGVRVIGQRLPRAALPAAGVVIGLVVLSLPPLWQGNLAPENLSRPEQLPDYWVEAGAHLDATDDGTRVLELPGADFTSYRWGTTVDPVTPGLTDRPIVARELVPMGSASAWNLLKAFDGRLQARLAEPAMVAPMARTMRAGQILVRSDLQYEHYDTPRPRDLWHFLQGVPGLGPATELGPPTANVASEPAPMLDELELSLDPDLRDPFPVSILPVAGALPIVTTKPQALPVVVAGDGDGLVDSAAAGLIDGTELIRYSAALSDHELAEALDDGAVLIVTDSNRRRAERWGTIRFTSGFTETAGFEPLVIDRTDARLPVFPDSDDDTRTVAVHRGGITARATSYGGRNEYLPEDRPANAVDGDPRTSWRAARDDPLRGERLELKVERPVRASTLTFLAPPPPINRWITRVALRFDGGEPLTVDLDESSRTGDGQVVPIGDRTFSTLTIEVLADSVGQRPRYGGLTSSGFAEVRIGDLRLDEAIRPPTDLLRRDLRATRGHALAIVLTRLRSAPTDVERLDEEPALVRLLDLPAARSFALVGTARLSPRAPDLTVDEILAGSSRPSVTATSSSRMAGPASRASAALDGDRSTTWTSAYGDQIGQWLELRSDEPRSVDRLRLAIVADGRHSVPTSIGVEVDGRPVATLAVPPITDGDAPNGSTTVELPLPGRVSGSTVRVVVQGVRAVETRDWSTRKVRTLPVALAEVVVDGFDRPAPKGQLATGCRDDLLELDGSPVPVEVAGTVEDALAGKPLELRACDGGAVSFRGGIHELRSAHGAETGIDIDRLVLRSTPEGAPSDALDETLVAEALRRPGASGDEPASGRAPSATVLGERQDSVSLRVRGARPGEPFWLTFGQSWNEGWTATAEGRDLGEPVLVDGFANGWLIEPTSSELDVTLRFAPQQRVTIALWGSLIAAIGCLGLVLRRPSKAPDAAAVPVASGEPQPVSGATVDGPDLPRLAAPRAALLGMLMTLLGGLLVTPIVGVLTGLLTVLSANGTLPRRLTVLAAPAAMAAAGGYVVITVVRHDISAGLEWPSELHRAHPIAWFAVLALVVDVVVVAVRGRRRR
ncbi:MAG: alpha-(1-_3)-arabinofuranosyltransferase domain-containing protein [Actinomycetota bacterium]